MPVLSDIQPRLQRHEQWLIGLRQDPDMTTAKIRIELEKQKGLAATLSQLETYFRHLGQRKNLSRHEWIIVFRALDSQRAFGHRFDLFISGKLISEEDLQKKRKNAKPPAILVECLADADRLIRQLPTGVTAKLHQESDAPGHLIRRNATLEPPSHTELNVKPHDNYHIPLDIVPAHSEAVPEPNATFITPGVLDTRIPDLFAELDVPLGPQLMPDRISFDPDIPDDWQSYFSDLFASGSLTGATELPDFQEQLESEATRSGTYSPVQDVTAPATATGGDGHHEPNLVEAARLLIEDSDSVISRCGRHPAYTSFTSAEDVLDNLQSLVPLETAERGLPGLSNAIGGIEASADHFLRLFLFSIVNNFAGLGSVPAKAIIKFMHQEEHTWPIIMRQLRIGTSTVFVRALTEKLFEVAIEAGDAPTVHDLLGLHTFDPDDIVCAEYHLTDEKSQGRRSPIEKAASLRRLDVVVQLLKHGVDVNKTYKSAESPAERGALECAIGLRGQYSSVKSDLVDVLLDSGATVRGRLLGAAICRGGVTLFQKLMFKLTPFEHEYCFSHTLTDAVERLSNYFSHNFIARLINECQVMHNFACVHSNQPLLVKLMFDAAMRDNRDLIDLLKDFGGQEGLNSALIGAARSGGHSLVKFLLSLGAHADGLCQIGQAHFTTPLAESIRRNDGELAAFLTGQGAWERIEEPKRLEAAMYAVAESESMAYLDQVLARVPKPDPTALTGPLHSAIKARHERLALRLVESGADVNHEATLVEALRIQSGSITWAVLESDMRTEYLVDESVLEAATAWGDPDIIQALIYMGANMAGKKRRSPLSIAIKAGKRELVDLLIHSGADLNISPESASIFSSFVPGRDEYASDEPLSPLAAAALIRDAGTANYLLEHGADPADEQAIINAITYDRELLSLILKKFRERYPTPHGGFGARVLHHVLQIRDDGALGACLRAGFDVNSMARDKHHGNVTAIGLAIKIHRGSHVLNLVGRLLRQGDGKPDVPSSDRIELVSSTGACRMVKAPVRQTALLDAIKTKSLPLIKLLISLAPDVNKEASLGLIQTPLTWAAHIWRTP